MRRLSIALIAAASTIALMQVASAADLPRKAPAYVAPLPPPPDWSGVYVGLEGGYGWGHQNLNAVVPGDCLNCIMEVVSGDLPLSKIYEPLFFPDVAVPDAKQKGWLFGGFAGAQKQWGSWVLGIEADFDGADIKGSGVNSATNVFSYRDNPVCGSTAWKCLTQTVTNDSKIDMLGSLRGKVGFALAPNWLIYGTGGLAYAHVKNAFTDTETVQHYDNNPWTFFSASGSGGTSMLGWAAGGGVDWKFWHDAGSAWILGVEYLHYGFGDQTITLSDNSGFGTVSFNTKERVDTVKGRISYLFAIH